MESAAKSRQFNQSNGLLISNHNYKKLEFEDVRLASHSISELQCHNRMLSKQKTSLFYIPMGKKNVSLRNCLNAVTQPRTQTFIDNNNSSMSTGMPVKQDTWKHPWWLSKWTLLTYSTILTRNRLSVDQFKESHHDTYCIYIRTIIQGKSTNSDEELSIYSN